MQTHDLFDRIEDYLGRPVHHERKLSPREGEVLRLTGKALSTHEIGERLGLSFKTVETYREQLKVKLRLENAAQLMRYAVLFDFVMEQPC